MGFIIKSNRMNQTYSGLIDPIYCYDHIPPTQTSKLLTQTHFI